MHTRCKTTIDTSKLKAISWEQIKRQCDERTSLSAIGGRGWCRNFSRSTLCIRWVYLMRLTGWTLVSVRGRALELMIMVRAVNIVWEKWTASSHILMCTGQYKTRKEPSICAVGMTPIHLLMIYIVRVTIRHPSTGIQHSMRWHQPMVTALIREVLPRWVKGMKIAPANLMGHVHPVAMILSYTN